MSGAPAPEQTSVLYVDMAYTNAVVQAKGHHNFFEARHSHGLFERVWAVHPLADRGGSKAGRTEEIQFSPRQVLIEGISASRKWPAILAPLDFLLSQRALLARLARLIEREHIDLIVTTDPVYSGLFGTLLKRRTKRPLAVGIYANFDFANRTFGFLAMRRLFPWLWLQNLVSRFVLGHADLVVGGSQNYLDWAIRHGASPDKGAVIPIARNIEPCHLSDPATRGSHEELFCSLGIPLHGRHMIMVSRLIPVKFAEDGVRAMIQAAKIEPGAIGIVAGDGPMQPELEALVAAEGLSERIVFIGHVSQEVLSRVVPQCVTISPLTGMALVECGLGGSPAVAYDADWQPEFVEDGVNGFIVPLGDHRAMGSRAAELLGNDGLRQRMSQAMRDHAVRRADRAAIAKIEREVFGKVLKRRTAA